MRPGDMYSVYSKPLNVWHSSQCLGPHLQRYRTCLIAKWSFRPVEYSIDQKVKTS
jgi:hypothetical protein